MCHAAPKRAAIGEFEPSDSPILPAHPVAFLSRVRGQGLQPTTTSGEWVAASVGYRLNHKFESNPNKTVICDPIKHVRAQLLLRFKSESYSCRRCPIRRRAGRSSGLPSRTRSSAPSPTACRCLICFFSGIVGIVDSWDPYSWAWRLSDRMTKSCTDTTLNVPRALDSLRAQSGDVA